MHRDLKLDNILIHFPDRDNIKNMTNEELKSIDLLTEKFVVKIADLGFAREIDDDSQKRRFTYVGSPLLMPPEQLITRWNDDSEGYDYKIDVWALGGIFYQMLTGMFIFLPQEKSSYDMALRNLNKLIQDGEWQWPTDVQISVSGFEFLTQILQFDPKLRPSWHELSNHQYFRMYDQNMIPLVVDFSQQPPEGIRFKDGRIYMNTKDPEIAEKMQDRLLAEVKNKEELQDLETLFMNHRLRMAADLDLFDELERHMEEENRYIEEKSEHMAKMSKTMIQVTNQLSQNNQENMVPGVQAQTMIEEHFEGFVTRATENTT